VDVPTQRFAGIDLIFNPVNDRTEHGGKKILSTSYLPLGVFSDMESFK
jgi:hypothetical protein